MKKSYIDPSQVPQLDHVTLGRVYAFLRPYLRYALLAISIILMISCFDLLPSLFVKQVIDKAVPKADLSLLTLLAIGMLVTPIAADLLGIAKKYLTTWISEKAMLDLRTQLFQHLHRQSLGFFATLKPGEAVSCILNDVEGIGSVLEGTLFGIVDDAVVLCSTITVIFLLDARLAIFSLLVLPLFIFPARKVGNQRKELKRQEQAGKAELTGILMETLSISGVLLVKLFGTEKHEAERFSCKARELIQLSLRQTLVGQQYQVLLGLFKSIGPALLFGFGGYLVIRGEIPLGTLVAFVTLLKRLYSPSTSLVGVHIKLMVSYAYFDRIFRVLDLQPAISNAPDAIRPPEIQGKVRFHNACFSYNPNQPTLSHIDLLIPPGQMVALVGPSGAGKSTLAMLIPRLFDLNEGTVYLDDRDIRSLDLAWLRDQIAAVTQETFLFNTSVLENLRYGQPQASMEDVIAAAKAAQIHDLIATLPDQYETKVGDRGYRFSGGERQRLAIARAILKNPRILILDEATSSLDSNNEALVQAALKPLLQDRTSLVIAHRLSTIVQADSILVLREGRIIERGTHSELLAANGFYAHLHEEQIRRTESSP